MIFIALVLLIFLIIFYGPHAKRRMDIYHGRGEFKHRGKFGGEC